METEFQTPSDPLFGIAPSEIPPHVLTATINEIVEQAHQLVGDALTEPVGFFAPGSELHRRRKAIGRTLPAVDESLLNEAIVHNRVVEIVLIPEPQRAFDPAREIASALLAIPVRAPDGTALAAAYLASTERREWSTSDLTMLRSAIRVAEADARLRIATRLSEEREETTAILAEFGAELAAVKQLDDVGPAIERAVTRVAAPDAVAIVELHDARVRVIGSTNIDERTEALIGSINIADPGPIANCLATTRSNFYASRPDLLEEYPQFSSTVANGLFHSWAIVPIMSDNNILGAVACHWHLPRDVREMKRSELEEVGRIAGLALSRVRVQETARHLAAIEAQLSASPTVATVISVVSGEIQRLLGAFSVHLGLLDGTELRQIATSGASVNRTVETVDLSSQVGKNTPVEDGKPLFLRPGDDWSCYPALSAARETLGAAAALAQPIMDEGKLIGILTAAYLHERDCGPYERHRAALVSVMLSRAIHRASLLDRERVITYGLQRSLLPDAFPSVEGYEIVARYAAAEDGVEVGGDWFDCFTLREGGLSISLGDIVGHGLEAAGATSQLRSACRALADFTDGPTDLVERLDEFSRHARATQFATMFYGELDTNTGNLHFCRAGHVPPVVIEPCGATRIIEYSGSWVIGLDLNAERQAGDLAIAPGTRLVIFTDGLIERRGEDIDVGYDRLLKAIERNRSLELDDFADALLSNLAAEVSSDDRCLLVIERL